MDVFGAAFALLKSRLSPERRKALRRQLNSRFRRLQYLGLRLFRVSDLRSLATYFGTDKGGHHRYIQHYEVYFAPLRRKRVVLLEIGIGGHEGPESGGSSLRMWRTYFSRGKIYGIDINEKSPHDEARIKTFVGSQDDETFLSRVVDEIGQTDIIIDDGSHVCEHIIKSFNVLFPKLKDGGYYVIEDTQTSYWPAFGGSDSDPDRPQTTIGFFKQLIHGLNHEERIDEREPSDYDKSILGISFYHNLIFIEKGDNVEGSNKGMVYDITTPLRKQEAYSG